MIWKLSVSSRGESRRLSLTMIPDGSSSKQTTPKYNVVSDVQDADLGALGGGEARVGGRLPEIGQGLDARPGRVAQHVAVDGRGLRSPARPRPREARTGESPPGRSRPGGGTCEGENEDQSETPACLEPLDPEVAARVESRFAHRQPGEADRSVYQTHRRVRAAPPAEDRGACDDSGPLQRIVPGRSQGRAPEHSAHTNPGPAGAYSGGGVEMERPRACRRRARAPNDRHAPELDPDHRPDAPRRGGSPERPRPT